MYILTRQEAPPRFSPTVCSCGLRDNAGAMAEFELSQLSLVASCNCACTCPWFTISAVFAAGTDSLERRSSWRCGLVPAISRSTLRTVSPSAEVTSSASISHATTRYRGRRLRVIVATSTCTNTTRTRWRWSCPESVTSCSTPAAQTGNRAAPTQSTPPSWMSMVTIASIRISKDAVASAATSLLQTSFVYCWKLRNRV